MSILKIILGDPNKKVLQELEKEVEKINELEAQLVGWEAPAFKEKTIELKEKIKQGADPDDFLHLAFAMVREAAKRTLGQRHYDVQLMGGITLHRGQIAEMRTGEGKTLTSTCAVYLNALAGRGVHVVTVNDYLAKRDAVWMGQIFDFLGVSTGCIQHMQAFIYDEKYQAKSDSEENVDGTKKSFLVDMDKLRPASRKEAYDADVTYGTNNEFGFDYLRDNMVMETEQMSQRGHYYAIVDEVDSILIDEARTPLIISAPAEESTERYFKYARIVSRLNENEDYNIDEKMRAATLTEQGISKMEKWLGVENIYTEGGIREVQHIENALKASALFQKDKDYVVKDGEVIIVDEFTGRMLPGRRYSEGLHQAIEAKEGVEIQRESLTLATVTLQNYFRMYKKLAGMTGTAATESEEFSRIYGLEVTVVPTNKPMVRDDMPDAIFKSEAGKFKAIIQEIKKRNEGGQPILVGTISIEKNELLSRLLEQEGIGHQLLNAKYHEKEAQILAQAGRKGAVTIATNMAGRGVDIILGGNPPNKEAQQGVLDVGGLHVIGTERHESRRIDNQLRGRSGRQGDPGSSQFFISMEDDLMRIFGGERLKGIMETLRVPDDMPVENRMISKSIEKAQQKVEQHNFDIRKHLVEYDDVINKQRDVVYNQRRKILNVSDEDAKNIKSENGKEIKLKEKFFEFFDSEIKRTVVFHTRAEEEREWNLKELYEVFHTIIPISEDDRPPLDELKRKYGVGEESSVKREAIRKYFKDIATDEFDKIRQALNKQNGSDGLLVGVLKGILLRSMDNLWIEHLEAMDHLRAGIGLRGYGQRDPLIEYKRESLRMFNELQVLIEKQVVYSFFKVTQAKELAPGQMENRRVQYTAPTKQQQDSFSQFKQASVAGEGEARKEDNIKARLKDETGKKVGRNDSCPCGSGKKYKRCCGA